MEQGRINGSYGGVDRGPSLGVIRILPDLPKSVYPLLNVESLLPPESDAIGLGEVLDLVMIYLRDGSIDHKTYLTSDNSNQVQVSDLDPASLRP